MRALHAHGFEIAVETNGTQLPPDGIDWICVSPKVGAPLVLTAGNELKLVYPQAGGEPERFADLDFEQFFLQPMDGPDRERNTELALAYCLVASAVAAEHSDAQAAGNSVIDAGWMERGAGSMTSAAPRWRCSRASGSSRRTSCRTCRRSIRARACTATRS